MKITLSRDEIKEIIRKYYNIEYDIKLEILEDKDKKMENKPAEPRYKTVYDANGMLTDVIPLNEDGSLSVPHRDHRGRTFKYENTCKVCGKVFYTNTKAADCCSQDCLNILNKELVENLKKEKKAKKKPAKKRKVTPPGQSTAFIVKRPKNDYIAIGEEIEEFCNSSEELKVITSDKLTPQGLYYRYRVAAQMFGYDSKIKMSARKNSKGIVISKR